MGTFLIFSLATEMVDNIAFCMDVKTLLAFRLACRELHAKSLRAFRVIFFNHVVVFLDPHSLGHLLEIAKRDVHACHVRKLTITTDRREEQVRRLYPPPPAAQSVMSEHPDVQGHELNILILAEALRKLRNLRRVRATERSAQAYSEGCYGLKPLVCGQEELRHPGIGCFPFVSGEVVGEVMKAVERSGRHELSLKIEFPTLSPTFNLETATWAYFCAPLTSSVTTTICCSPKMEGQLLLSTPNLKTLKMHPAYDSRWPLLGPLQVLQTYPDLRKLHLTEHGCSTQALVRFLEAHKGTLRSILLHQVSIDGSWELPLKELSEAPNLVNLNVAYLMGYSVPNRTRNSFGAYGEYPSDDSKGRVSLQQAVSTCTAKVLLRALLSDFRTFETVPDRWLRSHHLVDCRKAKAVQYGILMWDEDTGDFEGPYHEMSDEEDELDS